MTDSQVSSAGGCCTRGCRDLRVELLMEFLGRPSGAFCCGAWRWHTRWCAGAKAWAWATYNDGDGWGVPRLARDVPDASGGKPSRKRDWSECHPCAVSGRLEERAGQTSEPAGIGFGERVAVGDCEPVPVAAGDISGDWSTGGGIRGAADCRAVAGFQRDRRIVKKVDSRQLAVEEEEKEITQRRRKARRYAEEWREGPGDHSDVRNVTSRKKHATSMVDCRRTGNRLPGGHMARGVSAAKVFSEHARNS